MRRVGVGVLIGLAALLCASPVSALAGPADPRGITAGPDGAMWFAETARARIGRIDSAGNVTEFPIPSGANPVGITSGSDGALWFTEPAADRIGRMTTGGSVTEFTLPAGRYPLGIVAGPDGNLWFTERDGDRIGRISPTNSQASIVEFVVPGAGSAPTDITTDGTRMFFTEPGSNQIGRISTAGVIEFEISTGAGTTPTNIVFHPADGLLNFTEPGSDQIGRLGTAGGAVLQTAVPGAGSEPFDIASGSDGAVWFTEHGSDQIGRFTGGTITNEFAVLPGAPHGIASGSGAGAPLWFTMPPTDTIGRITTAGARDAFPLPAAPGPTGPAGPAGPTGETGATGSQGPAGALAVVAFQVKPRSQFAGKRVRVRFALTDSAHIALSVERLGKRGTRAPQVVAERDFPEGVGEIAWNGRLGGKRAKPGTYRLSVAAERDGSSDSSSIETKLKKKKRR